MTTTTGGEHLTDPTSEAALVSIGTELLREGPVAALITAVLAVDDNIEPDELQHHIVTSWINGIRPVRAVANKWGQETITKAAYRHVGYQSRVPDPSNMNPEHVVRIPLDVSRRHHMILVALNEDDNTAEICAADPTNSAVRDEAAFHLPNFTITWLVATDNAISAALNAIATRSEVDESEFIAEQTDVGHLGIEEDDADSGIVNYLNSLFNEAFANEASDIHLFPQPNGYEVRFRRDGVLIHRENVQERFGRGLVSRIRVMCQIRMSSNTKQDGGAAINVNNRRIDLRVSIIPSIWALPAVTIRLLASRAELMDLNTLYSAGFIRQYLAAVDLPDGFNLAVGRTGDGKTTALAATLNAIATPERKACSIEDPVENRLPHIVQVQVNEEAGLTYDEGMKAFLRSDPDIIMVGEIRDALTARISIQAAQTGHLVFGTLHIRDSASAPGRLIRDFGIEPAAIADTLNSVLAQRLLRCVCRDCRVPHDASPEELDTMNWPESWPSTEAKFFTARPGGCMNCKNTGYRGRKAAPELLVVSPTIQEAIVANEPGYRIREIALNEGMSPMWQTALGLAARGETTFEEIRRVLRTTGRHQ